MIKYILFDLDGTLLNMDELRFIQIYFLTLYQYAFKDENITLQECQNGILKTLNKMASDNRSELTNMEKFFDIFLQYFPSINRNRVISKTNEYYFSSEFDKCIAAVKKVPLIIDIISYLKQHNIKIAICTNPIFPREAIVKRIAWAGLDINDFEFVTFSEQYHYIKPNIRYYQEILSHIPSYRAEEVLMVGNDVEEDMIAEKLGINVFLITNQMISRFNKEFEIVNKGNYEEFFQYLKEIII